MKYATLEELNRRFGTRELQILAPGDEPAGIDPDLIEAALNDAQAEIDSYIGQRYRIPLSSVPDVLVGVACDLARFRLYSTNPTEEVMNRHNQRIAFLRDVSSGKAGIPVEGNQQGSALAVGFTGGGVRSFTRETLKGF